MIPTSILLAAMLTMRRPVVVGPSPMRPGEWREIGGPIEAGIGSYGGGYSWGHSCFSGGGGYGRGGVGYGHGHGGGRGRR